MGHLSKRVLARYLEADSISDIPLNMSNWKKVVDIYSERGDALPGLISRLSDPATQSKEDLTKSYSYIFAPENYYKAAMYAGLSGMFLAILQQYDLSPKDQKSIEKCAQFYSKRRALRYKDFNMAVKKFPEFLLTVKTQLSITQDILGRSKVRSAEADGLKVLDAGPFRVVNTGNFPAQIMETAAKVAQEAARRLSAKGLGKVCYGDILVSNRVNRNKDILAFYLIGKDEMFIRADLKGHEHDAVETTIHELAHRLQFKFLDSNKHSAIKSMYRRIEDGSQGAEDAAIQKLLDDPTTKPQEGDVVVEPRKKLDLVFKRLDYRHGKMVAVLKLKDESDTRANELSLSIKGWYSLKGIKLDIAKVGGFITPYAATHPDENFAEMVSAYCMSKLHSSQVEMLEEIIK